MATSATLATPKKACKPVEFHRDVSKNGFAFTRVIGPATYYIKDKLKFRAKARWNPQEKQWWVWGNALEMAFMKELEDDALAAMPLVQAHDERKLNAQLTDTAKAQLISEGHPAFAADTCVNATDEHIAMRGRDMIVAIEQRVRDLKAGAAAPVASCAAPVASCAAAPVASCAAAPVARSKCAVCDEVYEEIHNCAELVALGF